MGLVDTVMLGHYSETALAGAGIANSLLFAFTAFGMGVVMGLDSLVPQAIGAKEDRAARNLFIAGVRVCFIVGVPVTIVAAFSPFLLSAFAVDAAVSAEAWDYVWGRLPAIIPFLIFVAQRSFLQANDRTTSIVVAMVAANILNVGVDYLLIYGDPGLARLGLPTIGLRSLGTFGAAIASTIVSFFAMAIAGAAVARIPKPVNVGHDPEAVRRVFLLGMPVGLHLLAEVGVFSITQVLAGRLGQTPAAAHQVAVMLASFSFSIALGVGAACSVRVGQAVGSGDSASVRHAGAVGIALGASLMGCSGIIFALFPRELASLVTDEPHVVAAAVPLMRIAAAFQLSDAIQAVAAGALRGAGDTRSTFIGNLLGHYAVGLPLAIILAFPLGLGAAGLWWGLVAGLSSVAVGLSWRFFSLSKKPIQRV